MLLISKPSSALQPLPSSSSSTFSDSFSLSMPAAKRPKLSLQTSALPSAHYGTAGSNTGNGRIMDMATVTPTTLNTFNNTFDLSIRPSPISSIAPPSALSKPATKTPSSASVSRSKRQAPYELNLPLGVRPILKNSSLSRDIRRGSLSAAASASPLSASTGRRVFFPEPKRVKFAGEEEVVTKLYTRRHVDISSSEDEESSNGSGSEDGSPPLAPSGDKAEDEERASASRLSTKTSENVDEVQRGRTQSRRRSSSSGGRKTRKRRRWEWTLGTATTEEDASSSPRDFEATKTLSQPDLTSAVEAKKDTVAVAVDEVQPTPSPADGNDEAPS